MNHTDSYSLTRRSFLAGMSLSPAAAMLGAAQATTPSRGVKVVDVHGHLSQHRRPDWKEANRRYIDAMDKLGIDQSAVSMVVHNATPDQMREVNNWVYEATKRFPAAFLAKPLESRMAGIGG